MDSNLSGAFLLYLLTAGLAFGGTQCLLRWQSRLPILDVPNERSSHRQPTPRTGGIAIFTAFICGSLFWRCAGQSLEDAPWVLLGGSAFFTLGLLDDIFHLPEWIRFVVAISLSTTIAAFGPRLEALALPGLPPWRLPSAVAVAATAFWYTGFLNLFNFMDGTDGMAAGEAALAGLFMWAATGSPWPLILSAAALGFLPFNYQPSRIFMGDSGSYFIGFLLAILSVMGSRGGNGPSVPFVVFVLILGTFIVDTTATLMRRIINGETWYKAHRSHYYQKLSDLGWSHAQLAWLNIGLTACLGATGLIYPRLGPQAQLGSLLGWGGFFAAGILAIHRRERSIRS